jgi:hypothetical protein
MKNALVLVCVITSFLLLVGCSIQSSQVMDDSADEPTKTVATKAPTTKATPTVKTTSENTDVDNSGGGTVTIEGPSGSTSSFQNMGDYRDNKMGQKCDMDSPFACSEYVARDGMLSFHLKYNGYPSKIDNVVVQLNDEDCDPIDTYMEPGSVKEFTCYIDAEDQIVGKIEVSYHDAIARKDVVKTGTIVANIV